MKIDDALTYVGHEEDVPFLRSKLLDVNMRLFHVSSSYRDFIVFCSALLKERALEEYDDYKQLRGISGANVGIPFNIIGIVRGLNEAGIRWVEIMLNPRITAMYGPVVECTTNCGSVRLPAPIVVKRHELIDLVWYDLHGDSQHAIGVNRALGSLTIQHEVEHNQGILITDHV